ncbi:ABC transporter permease [Streptomyces sp. NPDC058665]|uniref:ABC transporter permease n=1 Tax=Streptomyces sp. NPDC058665 TaxID=3346586 RepID=UPI003661A871
MTTLSQAPPRTLTRLTGNTWVRFAARRAGRLVLSLWVLVTAAFLMIHLIPGDPVRAALGPTAPASLVAARRADLGLDDPLPVQYVHYLRDVISGDLGTSMTFNLPASQVIGDRLPATLQLALTAFAVAVVIAVPVGVLMGVLTRGGRARRTELGFTGTSVVLAAIPDFLLGVVLVYVFGVSLGWLPVAGSAAPSSYVLPVLSLAVGTAAVLARLLRVQMVTVLEADYIRTARAKRLPAAALYLRHALPNALAATITVGGLLLSSMVAGSVLVENVFAWQGLGNTIVHSILAKDYPLVQGIVLIYGVGVLLVNVVVDVAVALLDPHSATIRES